MAKGRARQLLAVHGEVSSQTPSDWAGTIALPAWVEQYYDDIGPADVTIEFYGNPWFLPRLARLWDYQAGYRRHGVTGVRITDWPEEWLVVGSDGGAALIVSASLGSVTLAVHGSGTWNPIPVFPDLPAMAACLGYLGCVVRDAGEDLLDDDYLIRATWRAQAAAGLMEFLDSASEAPEVLAALGWG